MTDASQIIARAIREAQPDAVAGALLATVTAVNNATGVTVQFDGETAASGRLYRAIGPAKVGDRVVMLRVGSTYVCAGAVLTAPNGTGVGGQTGLVYAAATQTQDVTINHGLPWTPSAVQVTPSDERFLVATKSITSTQITFRSYYVLGTVVAGFAMQLHWHADR